MNIPLHGLVLGGGRSRRMQRDKSRVEYHGSSQMAWTANLLREFCREVRVSVRPGQESPSDVAAAPLYDRHGSVGPLDGIVSALTENPDVAWLIVACDLPLLSDATLRTLVAGRKRDCPVTAFRSSGDGLPEPLCAIYEPESRAILADFLERKRSCPRRILIELDLPLLDLPDPRALDNINTPDEYETVRKTLRADGKRRDASAHTKEEA